MAPLYKNSPPVRDSATLKGVNYSGAGHEKYPSWPTAAAADIPLAVRGPVTGGSHRSKSWTDHTNYPKEQAPIPMRPYMKRSHAASVGSNTQHLKTVMERSEQSRIVTTTSEGISSTYEQFDSTRLIPIHDEPEKRSSSPPERDTDQMSLRGLSKKDLESYNTSYAESTISQDTGKFSPTSSQLTRAELEEYTRTYDEVLATQHVKQSSYAQSEGYHSYVSSTDSMSTPFLDRLRRDSALNTLSGENVSREGRDSVATIHSCSDSVVTSNSGSSSETLKWHGSMSDVSVASSSMGTGKN
ncbi:protein Shroom-like [Ctenocephalides felis]|uniref:protein Shroom-like n=1 Tax=Ctenocephalides felis TaxID=7515 RepID=UPI000E6E15A6|nr:protein Shroom-like [Ctenocephalides felis]